MHTKDSKINSCMQKKFLCTQIHAKGNESLHIQYMSTLSDKTLTERKNMATRAMISIVRVCVCA